MRIAYISTLRNSSWGGSEELWHQSAALALAEGHQVGVFVYDWPEPIQLKTLREKGAVIFRRSRGMSFRKRMKERLASIVPIKSANPYYDVINFAPDRIVVTDGSTYYTSDDKWLTAILKLFRKKYIIICQANGAYRLPASRTNALDLFQSAQEVVFVAENNRLQAFHQLASDEFKSVVIQNPAMLKSFEPSPFPSFDDGKIHCALVGRLCVGDKGQDIVVAMMAEPFWKNSNVVIHIYGKGADLDYLKRLVRYYNVEDRVIFEGFSTPESIWEQCHCLIMPSILEGTPLTLMEGMVVGRICIVSDVGGNAEWIVDGVNGYLVSAPTQELFSDKLKRVLSERDWWQQISAKASKDALARLDRLPGQRLLQRIIL